MIVWLTRQPLQAAADAAAYTHIYVHVKFFLCITFQVSPGIINAMVGPVPHSFLLLGPPDSTAQHSLLLESNAENTPGEHRSREQQWSNNCTTHA